MLFPFGTALRGSGCLAPAPPAVGVSAGGSAAATPLSQGSPSQPGAVGNGSAQGMITNLEKKRQRTTLPPSSRALCQDSAVLCREQKLVLQASRVKCTVKTGASLRRSKLQ